MITKPSLLILALFMGACTLQNPSMIHQEKIQVSSEAYRYERSADRVTQNDLVDLADQIKRRGDSPVTIRITYPLKPNATTQQRIANVQAQRIKTVLSTEGVKQPIILDLQANGKSTPNLIQVSFTALQANAGCEGHLTDADANNYTQTTDVNYGFGCSHDRYLSAMIARPDDLLGNDTTSDAQSQRLSKSLDTYRAGDAVTPASAQEISASDVYN